jgi:hypothetical protein
MILSRHLGEDARQVGVYSLAGESTALAVHKSHKDNPAVKTKPLCLLDGDSSIPEDILNGVIKLPGSQPESYIYNYCLEKLHIGAAMLSAMCHYDVDRQSEFISKVKGVTISTADPHLYFTKLGTELGFISESVVKRAFISYWLNTDNDSAERIANIVRESLNN